MCVLGKRLLKDISIVNCTKAIGGELHNQFCPNKTCDPYYLSNNISIVQGIKASSLFSLHMKLRGRNSISFLLSFLPITREPRFYHIH